MHPVVLNAIASLVADNRTPTVALTKAKLSEPVPMPLVIAGVTAYKSNPDCINDAPQHVPTPSRADNDAQLDRIEHKLDLLLSILQKY